MSDGRDKLLNDPETVFRLALDGRQSDIYSALPGIVTSVDFGAQTCEVQPAIKGVVQLEDGTEQSVSLPLLVDVPIVFPSAGGFTITFPLKIGDEVLVVFSSRCIDAWWQLGGVQVPMEARMHDLSDGFAIPGPRSQPRVVTGISSTAVQIRNDAGTAIIEIDATGKIKLVSVTGVEVDGNLVVTGSISAPTIAAATGVTIDGIPFGTHTHPVSVPSTPFTGTTGGPT